MRRPINNGLTSKGSQRYRCLNCKQTFTDRFETIDNRRQVTQEEVRAELALHPWTWNDLVTSPTLC